MPRVYKGGRDTGRWTRGDEIGRTDEVLAGDVLYLVSHRWGADNLIRVVATHESGFDYRYVTGELVAASHLMRMWPHELRRDQCNLYKVVAEKEKVRDGL